MPKEGLISIYEHKYEINFDLIFHTERKSMEYYTGLNFYG